MSLQKYIKPFLITLWLIMVIISLTFYYFVQEFFVPKNLKIFFIEFYEYFFILYLLISILRGLTLIPSTPFILMGILLFPQYPIFVFFISIIGILVSSSFVYFFSEFLGFDLFFEKHYKNKIEKLRKLLLVFGL